MVAVVNEIKNTPRCCPGVPIAAEQLATTAPFDDAQSSPVSGTPVPRASVAVTVNALVCVFEIVLETPARPMSFS